MTAGVDRSAVSRAWRTRGSGCDLQVDAPGKCREDFVHDVDELVVAVEGEMEFGSGGIVARSGPGEELHIPAGVARSVRALGNRTARWLCGYRRS